MHIISKHLVAIFPSSNSTHDVLDCSFFLGLDAAYRDRPQSARNEIALAFKFHNTDLQLLDFSHKSVLPTRGVRNLHISIR